ncbi:MAG: DinB family protein [Chloroflexi bacterium]|nr:DinB family protein [Chloroflexota bacterium]
MTQDDVALDIDAAAWRLRLLARLAAERANLLRHLRGIDEATLLASFIDDDWTAKDILAHVGSWDAFHTERMSLVLNGRINAIREFGGPGEMDARNVEIHTFSANLSLEQALTLCLKERDIFLSVLSRSPDDLLQQEIEMPWGWRTSMRRWAEWRCEHDAVHAQQLQIWRQQLAKEQKQQIGPIFILRAILNATRDEFYALTDCIPASQRETRPVCGHWTLKDLVGHLTDWERVGVTGLRQIAAGKTPNFDEPILDFEVWNTDHAAARQSQPWETVWADFINTRRELLALVDEIDEARWGRPFDAPWNAQSNAYQWTLIWSGHEYEHAQDIRDTLNVE